MFANMTRETLSSDFVIDKTVYYTVVFQVPLRIRMCNIGIIEKMN